MNLKSSNKTDVNMTELVVEIDAESFEKAVEAAYQRQKKNISMPGFRKGKVPRKMCERTYGENVFYEDAINALLNMELPALIVDNKLNVVDTPKVEVTAVSKEDGVTMKVICVTKPEISLEGYKGIEAPKVVKEIADEDVDQQIESMRQRNARVVSVDDRAAEMGDEVNLNFEGFFGDEAFDGGKGENYQLKLGSGQFIPGFEDQLVGHSIGEEFEINVTFPEEYQMPDLAGKPATFKIKINSISVKELPAFDDDFAKDTSDFDTAEEFRADMKKHMEENAEKSAASAFENYVFDTLIKNTEAVIPNVMFEHRIDTLIQNFEQSLQQQGMSLDIYLQYTGMTMDAFRDTFEERAQNEVKLRLALEKIAEMENIQVTEEEINEGLAPLVAQSGLELEAIKSRIPMEDYIVDLKVGKAADLVKEAAVVDNTIEEEKPAEEAAE